MKKAAMLRKNGTSNTMESKEENDMTATDRPRLTRKGQRDLMDKK
jgi:hypothetical protein